MRHATAVSLRPTGRTALLATLAAALLAASGCSWFNRDGGLYASNPADRPLEVPPDLDLPTAAGAQPGVDTTASALRSETRPQGTSAPTAATAAAGGFTVALPRDQAFARVGEVLDGIDGLQVASKAQLLGAYDVSYQGADFLVRVSEVQGGSYVSAVDPRGVPAAGEGPTALLAALEAALAGN